MVRTTALAFAAALLVAGQALAQEVTPTPQPRTFTLTGVGEIAAEPDIAQVSLAVVTEAETAAEAFSRQRERAAAVVAAIKGAGIEDRDIMTSNVSIRPRMRRPKDEAPTIEGYTAQNGIAIRVREIERTGTLLDALVKAGVNQIEGITFDFSNREAVVDRARRAAAADVRSKADLYSAALGVKVVRLISLVETDGGDNRPRPMMRNFAMSAAKEASTPITPGEQTVRISVSAVFEIE